MADYVWEYSQSTILTGDHSIALAAFEQWPPSVFPQQMLYAGER